MKTLVRCPVCGRMFRPYTLRTLACSERCYWQLSRHRPELYQQCLAESDRKIQERTEAVRAFVKERGKLGATFPECARVGGVTRGVAEFIINSMPDIYEDDDCRLYYNTEYCGSGK